MYRKLLLLLCLAILIVTSVCAEGYSPQVGETLEYKVIVKSIISAGNQTIKTGAKSIFQNHEVVEVSSKMTSVGKFEETERILLDLAGLYPRYIYREVHDKDKLRIEEVTFDYDRNLMIRSFSKDGAPKQTEEKPLPGPIQDGLSLQFFLRKTNLAPGSYNVQFYSNGNIEQTPYNVTFVKDTLKLNVGTFKEYFQVEHPKSNITILLANTPERWPLLIRKNASFGKIEVKLEKVK